MAWCSIDFEKSIIDTHVRSGFELLSVFVVKIMVVEMPDARMGWLLVLAQRYHPSKPCCVCLSLL
jgi:hypothetical protein